MCASEKILEYLRDSGITQTFLSKKSGIPLSKLNLALHGKRRLPLPEYEAICWALDVSTDKFLTPKKLNSRIA